VIVSSQRIGTLVITPQCPKLSHMAGNPMYLPAVIVIELMGLVVPKTQISPGSLLIISCSRWPISEVEQEGVHYHNGYQ
jgi:hypothetical protein